MKLLSALVLFVALSFLVSCQKEAPSETKIIGGHEAGDYKWFAGLKLRSGMQPLCGGAFIAPRVVVTAAHCLQDLKETISVRPGTNNKNPAGEPEIKVTSVLVHPKFNRALLQNDIGLLFLEDYDRSKIEVETINLNAKTDLPLDESSAITTVIGRGEKTSYGSIFEDVVYEVDLNVVPVEACKKAYNTPERKMITANQICTGDLENGAYDSCQGDSGGPLIADDNGTKSLVGVVSWGRGCAQRQAPGVYTRVSSQLKWINESIEINERNDSQKLSNDSIKYLAKTKCYLNNFERTERDENSSKMITRYSAPSLVEDFRVDEDASEISSDCSFVKESGDQIKMGYNSDKSKLFAVNMSTGVRWSADPIFKYSLAYMQCYTDSNKFQLRYSFEDGRGAVAMDGQMFDVDNKKSATPIDENAIRTSCDINDKSGVVFIEEKKQDKSIYKVLMKDTLFGSEGKLVSLEKRPELLQEKQVKIKLNLGQENKNGTLEVTNSAADKYGRTVDIISWELKCNFAFSLENGGTQFVSKTEYGTGSYLFAYPATPLAIVRKGESIPFDITLEEPLLGGARCIINGKRADVEVSEL